MKHLQLHSEGGIECNLKKRIFFISRLYSFVSLPITEDMYVFETRKQEMKLLQKKNIVNTLQPINTVFCDYLK